MTTETTIRPFRVDVPEEDLDDLRRRIAATRWTSKELVEDRSQGVQLATLQELARYWTTDYDWRKAEEKLNALPQFTTEIDGLDIHFIHVRSQHEDALPLIMTHGWPGSVIELLETVGPLTDPTAHGGRGGRVPPGAAVPARLRLLRRAHRARLERRPRRAGLAELEPPRIYALRRPGRRRGGPRHRRDGTPGARGAGRHPREPARNGAGRPPAGGIGGGTRSGGAARHIQGERLWLLPGDGHAAADDRLRLAGVTRRPGRLAARPRHGQLLQDLPRLRRRGARGQSHPGDIVDNITLYWLTGTGASAARSYWEDGRALAAAQASGQAPPEVSVPVGFTTFPGEIWRTPRSWVENSYPNLTYFNEVDKGGHFAAWEEPELFATEVREAFRSLR